MRLPNMYLLEVARRRVPSLTATCLFNWRRRDAGNNKIVYRTQLFFAAASAVVVIVVVFRNNYNMALTGARTRAVPTSANKRKAQRENGVADATRVRYRFAISQHILKGNTFGTFINHLAEQRLPCVRSLYSVMCLHITWNIVSPMRRQPR